MTLRPRAWALAGGTGACCRDGGVRCFGFALALFVLAMSPAHGRDQSPATLAIADYPPYKLLQADKVLNDQFFQYMRQMSTCAPDGKRVFALMQSGAGSLDALSTIFHEKVEFVGWLNLHHKFEDIMNVSYYQSHYEEVYPIAHRKAVIEELGLIRFFARKKGLPDVPEVAYNLTSPLIELFDAPVERMQNRLKYNLEYLAQVRFVTTSDLKTAIGVYEAGGYTYKDKERILSEGAALIKASQAP